MNLLLAAGALGQWDPPRHPPSCPTPYSYFDSIGCEGCGIPKYKGCCTTTSHYERPGVDPTMWKCHCDYTNVCDSPPPPPPPPPEENVSNHFESYILALEWQPSSALDACPGGRRPNAALVKHMDSPAGTFCRQHLSLHGLWPHNDALLHKGFEWPQYCQVLGRQTSHNYSTCMKNMSDAKCQPNKAALALYNSSENWQTWAPRYAYVDGFAAHEWAKHGSCTAHDPEARGDYQYDYWKAQKAALDNVSMGFGATLVTRNIGGFVSRSELQAAFDADAGGHHTTLVCVRGCDLDQVWLGFAAAKTAIFDDPWMAPIVMPSHGVNTVSPDGCSDECTIPGPYVGAYVHIRSWNGCEGSVHDAGPRVE